MDRLDLELVGAKEPVLRRRAVSMIDAMEATDRLLFDALRERVRCGDGRPALAPWLDVGAPSGQHYDALDGLFAGILALDEPATPPVALPPDMVFYQPTPARHIVDCIARAGIAAHEVVLDLGSGLGHVPLLVNMLTGARCLGVERDAGYVEVALRAAENLRLHDVNFVAADARDADFAGVDVFYLFTPFIGEVLRDVLVKIEAEARSRPLRIVSLGPCTRTLSRMSWLQADDDQSAVPERIALFRSRVPA